MAKVNCLKMDGAAAGELELAAAVFEAEKNIPLMHQAVVAEEANMRQGTSDSKTRTDVSGGGAKPYRQKGTGRARQGSIRAPHYYHGGVVFGPHPRSFAKNMPKKMRRGALRSALSAQFADGLISVVDEIKADSISTKQFASFLKTMGDAKRYLVVLDKADDMIWKSARNIPGVEVRVSPCVSVRDLLVAKKIIMTKAAVERLEEVLG
ncbi:MAG: 50S ribosomal protein L4 [Abditibacteriota bacterium]|nr:50S ribosomal protein L4 [Abditibacteriota bacterium]MBP5093752.1 50S ribosomal protein L4 [Abditibacteriota bacterium]MBP5717519.1 50S ribosomal protein L4 [Abditibacteriota bacterium]MBP5737931.1 50S ribosomal protein L4 [Abditibacteriota bacterium]MBQ7525449.1 50S ribosomal protein L4 [Abditibacteriota bacterium]